MDKRFLFRMIVPAMNDNIFSRLMKKTIALGPVMVATSAGKLLDWDVEIIHEAGCQKLIPRDAEGNIDHIALQAERPADVVGFYGSISSTMPRIWKLAKFYQSQGILTISGGLHPHYEPLESLQNGIDAIVHGDGEKTIRKILLNFQEADKKMDFFPRIAGLSFIQDGEVITTAQSPTSIGYCSYLENLPPPDFGLIRDAKIKVYPIGRIRGCGMNCEFCSVKEKARWSSPNKLFSTVQWLVETRKVKEFFLVDDRMEEDKEGSRNFFGLIKEKYGRKLDFTVQIRLEASRDEKFLSLLREAGVQRVCIGYESPIDEELMAMKKGILSAEMTRLTRVYHQFGFFIHAMFIFGYPGVINSLSAKERMKRFKKFIRQSEVDSIQVLKPIPIVGSELRRRLKKEGKLLPLTIVPWDKYDGNYACFIPDDMSVRELQEYPIKIMKWFYHGRSFWRIGLRTVTMPFDYLLRGWHKWHHGWWNDIVRFGGNRLYRRWRRESDKAFVKRLESFINNRAPRLT